MKKKKKSSGKIKIFYKKLNKYNMRLKIKLSGTNEKLPINNQHIVNGFFYKLLGENNKFHDNQSDYNVSSLRGGKFIGNKEISFNNGGYIMVSAYDQEVLNLLLIGMMNHQTFYKNIKINGFEYLPNEKYYNGWNHFKTLSPILLKKKGKFKTLNDDDFIYELTQQTKRKLKNINAKLNLSELEISIKSHPAHKVKKILVKNVINKASQCQLSIKCSKEIANILYNVGVGNSTGSGFGMIYKTENKHLYQN